MIRDIISVSLSFRCPSTVHLCGGVGFKSVYTTALPVIYAVSMPLESKAIPANTELSVETTVILNRTINEIKNLQSIQGMNQSMDNLSITWELNGTHWNSSVPELIFTPHLLPVTRGILSTIYLPIAPGTKEDDIRAILGETYSDEPFIKLLPSNQNVSLAHVLHSNICVFGVNLTRDTLIITSAIDNLVKGAAGQAVQNMNIVYGITETCGLK